MPNRIPSLDGLRAISIALVLLGHLSGTVDFPGFEVEAWVGDYANLGVLTFFVISGFLITGLLLNELEATNQISLKMFYIRRSIRIFPAYFAYLGVVAALAGVGVFQLHRFDLLASITYTVNFHPHRSWYVGHLWSLSVEEQFYLLWPLAIKMLGPSKAFVLAVGMFFLSPLTRGIMLVSFDSDIRDLEIFPAVAGGLAAGCLLAGLRPWLSAQRWYCWITGSYLMAIVPLIVIACNSMRARTVGAVVGEPIIYVCLAVGIDACVRYPNGLFGKLLNSRPFVIVGSLSYSLYLWQQIFLNRHSTAWLTTFPYNLIATVAVACTSYFAFEKPLMQLRQRFKSGAQARSKCNAHVDVEERSRVV